MFVKKRTEKNIFLFYTQTSKKYYNKKKSKSRSVTDFTIIGRNRNDKKSTKRNANSIVFNEITKWRNETEKLTESL